MTAKDDNADNAQSFTFADAERVQLRDWIGLATSAKIDFFEEMIELGYRSGALTPERLAMRDAPPKPRGLAQDPTIGS